MSLTTTLNGISWDLLDALRLGEFFDNHGIPPLLFPLLLIGIAALAVFLIMLPPSEPASECGDGICSGNETAASCPQDCETSEPEGRTVKVFVDGGTLCSDLDASLKEQSGAVIARKSNQNWAITFTDVKAETVSAEISSQQSSRNPVSSPSIDLDEDNVIRVTLPSDYCSETPEFGSLSVRVEDASNGDLITANVVLFDSGDTIKDSKTIDGQGSFTNLRAEARYYLTATAEGYGDYYGKSESFIIETNDQRSVTVPLNPISTAPDETPTGELEVCVVGDGEPIEHSGEIGVYDVNDDLYAVGRLSDCSLFRGQATGDGCYIFSLPAGRQFFAGINRAPSGCSIADREGPFLIAEGDKELVTLDIACNLTGRVRAIVHGNNSQVLTANCTVELYHDNGTKIRTMNLSSDGEHTEYVTLPDGTDAYVHAKNVPQGYLETRSSSRSVDADDNLTVDITLDTPPPPLPNLTIVGPSVPSQILYKGDNFTATVRRVKLAGTEVGKSDGVTLACEASWGQTVEANHTDGWWCNLTAPDMEGRKTILFRATKDGANEAAETIDVFVVNKSVGLLHISERAVNPLRPVVIDFNITAWNGTDTIPVEAVHEASLLVAFKRSGGVVVNKTSLSGSNSHFSTSFFVPFRGEYEYDLEAKSVVDGKLYRGLFSSNFTVLQGAATSLSCSVSPRLVGPEETFNVTAEFAPLNGKPVAGQRVKVTVGGRGESAEVPMIWNPEEETYEAETAALTSECKYTVNCSATDDPAIWEDTELYVADPDAYNVNPLECPSNFHCDSLQDVRNCYKYWTRNPNLAQPIVNNIISCAGRGLPGCSGQASDSSQCHQALKLKVRVSNSTDSNTTGFLYFRVPGTDDGQDSILPYDRPHVDGTEEYSMADIHASGGQSEPAADHPGERTDPFSTQAMVVAIDQSTGELSAQAYCPLSCGGLGDLDGVSGVTASDISVMKSVIDTISVLGAPPYGSWPPPCVDVNGDGFVTAHDLLCLSGASGGLYSGFDDCEDCSPTGLEICNDGLDNDCDGQIDSDTYDEPAEDFYSFSDGEIEDLCGCTASTPCEMLYDPSGGVSDISSESDVKRCASLSSLGGEYHWYSQTEWQCDSSKAGSVLICGGVTYTCDGASGEWTRLGGAGIYPPNPL